MSTRACYIFKDHDTSSTVYVHQDGYPSWAWRYFRDTIASGLAWPLPRFEADEFSAAFVATVKTRPGSVRLVPRWNIVPDIAYLYKLTISKGNVLILKIEAVDAPESGSLKPSRWKRETVYHGPLHRVIFAEGDLTVAWDASRSTGLKIGQINRILQEPVAVNGLGPALAKVTARLDANSAGDNALVKEAYSVLAGAGLTRAGL